MSMTLDDQQNETSYFSRECAICGSKAIGINFGAPTCAPCKAFFRRNARRRQILDSPCRHRDITLLMVNHDEHSNKFNRDLQIRRCSSCRLRRCFDRGMKEELVRTDEENERHKQLVDTNRKRRELFKEKQQHKLLAIPQFMVKNNEYLRDSDWRHLSNVVSAYETYCLQIYVKQRSAMFNNETKSYLYESMSMKPYTALPMCLTTSVFSFIRALPAFHSLSQVNQNYLTKNNLRSLIFPNMFELNQTCYSEPWQASFDKATWQFICGSEVYEELVRTINLAERLLITDPTITRLWIVILFFSTPLFCLYDSNISLKVPKKRTNINDIQDAYITLLWNYLLHRYGNIDAVQIYSKLIHVYLKMQHCGFNIGVQVRTRNELLVTHETLNKLLTLAIHDN